MAVAMLNPLQTAPKGAPPAIIQLDRRGALAAFDPCEIIENRIVLTVPFYIAERSATKIWDNLN